MRPKDSLIPSYGYIIIGITIVILAFLYLFAPSQSSNVPEGEHLDNMSDERLDSLETLLDSEKSAEVAISEGPTDYNPTRLEIEQLDIDVSILPVSVNPEGHVSTPANNAGFWIASSKLNQAGNIVVVGHNRQAPRQIFSNLALAQDGLEIVITDAKAREYQFTISEIQIINVNGSDSGSDRVIDLMTAETGSQQLTLVSCYPDIECADRIVVTARPVAVK